MKSLHSRLHCRACPLRLRQTLLTSHQMFLIFFFAEDANRHFLRRDYRVHLLTKRNINETKRSRYVIRARMSMKSQNRSRCLAANPRNCVTINLESDDWRNLISALASPFEVARVQKLRRLRIGVFVWRTFARIKASQPRAKHICVRSNFSASLFSRMYAGLTI